MEEQIGKGMRALPNIPEEEYDGYGGEEEEVEADDNGK